MVFGFATRILAVIGIIAVIAAVFVFYPNLLPLAQNEWNKMQPPRCTTASDCILANNSCCSNQSGNWTCAALDAHCAPNWVARVAGCWCGSGVCAANYSCEPERPTPTVDLPPFPPEDLEASVEPSAEASAEASIEPSSIPSTGLANPASVHCVENNGALEILNGLETPGQVGYCFFADGTVCEEWAFFRGECKPGDCNVTCIGVGTRSEGWKDCNGKFLGYANCA